MNSNILSKYWIIGYIVLIGMFHSCAPTYVPNMVNTPLFNGKKQFNANIGIGTNGFDPQLAVSITDHIAIMANASFANRTSDSTDNFHKHQFFEGGVGYFTSPANGLILEVFGGYGAGRVKGFDKGIFMNHIADANYQRVFLQPAVGYTCNVFDASFSPRLVFIKVNYNNVLESGEIRTKGFTPFIEPTITAKVGFEYVKLYGQLGFSMPFDSNISYDNQWLMISVGLQVTLGKKWESNK